MDDIKTATAKLVELRRTMTFAAELTGTERAEHNRLCLGPRKLRILGNRLQRRNKTGACCRRRSICESSNAR